MALSRATNLIESSIGHNENAIIEQDVSNPNKDADKYGDPNEKMKALVWMGKGSVKIVETPKPKIIEDTDVILKVTGSTICGSDLHLYHGSIIQLQKGDILGHEFCGKVDSVGSAVKHLKKGQRTVASFQIACGECMYCKQKLSSQCEKTNANKTQTSMFGGGTGALFGYSHFTGGFAGGQAEYVRVPLGEVNLLPLPDDVPDEKGLYLSDVLCTSWHCVVDTGVKKGDVVAIWGAGPIGQMCADMAFINGADRVIVIDGGQGAWRLDFIKSKVPKVETVDYTKLQKGESVTSKLKEMAHDGPDVALECAAGEYAKGWAHYFEILVGAETDTSELLNEMITSVRSFGRCGVTGVYVGFTNHFNIGSLMERGIRLIGNGQAPVHKYWKELLEMVRQDKLDPLQMITHRIRIDEMAEAYRMFDQKEDNMQKVFVETKFSSPPAPGAPHVATLSKSK